MLLLRRPTFEEASMEPQGLGCGVAIINELSNLSAKASMEPQGLGCGVLRRWQSPTLEGDRLQWSHRV